MFRDKRIPFRSAVFNRAARPPDANDARRAVECHEHYADAGVVWFVQVGVRLDAAAGEVHVPESGGREDSEV